MPFVCCLDDLDVNLSQPFTVSPFFLVSPFENIRTATEGARIEGRRLPARTLPCATGTPDNSG